MIRSNMKVGIVGCGKVATQIHIPSFQAMRGVEVVAVCDNMENHAKKTNEMFSIGQDYTDMLDMIKKEKLDIVDICTPPGTHLPLSIQALEAGCHVLLEKPMVPDADSANKLVKESKKYDVKLCVVHNYLFRPNVIKARSIIEEGGIGDLLSVDIKFFDRKDNQFMSKDHWCHNLPGGRFGENIIHPLYLMDDFLGISDIMAVYAKKIGNCNWTAVDELRMLVDTKKSIGTISMSTNAPRDVDTIDIYGTEGILRIDLGIPDVIKIRARKYKWYFDIIDNLGFNYKKTVNVISSPLKCIINKQHVRSGHYYLIQKFIESIQKDKNPPVPVDMAKKMIILQEKIFKQCGIDWQHRQ